MRSIFNSGVAYLTGVKKSGQDKSHLCDLCALEWSGREIAFLHNRKVLFNFILTHMGAVAIPLDLFVFNELVEDVIAQGLTHQLALFNLLNRFKKVSWQ